MYSFVFTTCTPPLMVQSSTLLTHYSKSIAFETSSNIMMRKLLSKKISNSDITVSHSVLRELEDYTKQMIVANYLDNLFKIVNKTMKSPQRQEKMEAFAKAFINRKATTST